MGVAALLLLAWAAFHHRAPFSEPVYQGKPLSAWTVALNTPGMHDQAESVIRAAGTNAVPCLGQLLRTPDPPLARLVKFVTRHTPDRLSQLLNRVFHPYSGSAQRAAAAQALRLLGPEAEAALPALADALGDDQTVSWHAALSLAQLGQPGTTALMKALPKSAPAQTDFICYALSLQGPSASNAIPTLAAFLERGDPQHGEWVARALAGIGKPSLPQLLQSLEHMNPSVRLVAIKALASIGPPARTATTNLLQHARVDERVVRLAAIEALPKVRPSGAGITDTLTNLTHDPDPQIRAKALDALHQIP
jgi:HEAT repeat protein